VANPSSFPQSASVETQANQASAGIVVEKLGMQLRAGQHLVTILQDITFAIPSGQVVAIVGPSGSGKSTLLGLLAGLDRPTSGSIRLQGTDITRLNESDMARFRRQHIGYVFQAFHLLPTLTALENVLLPLELQGTADGMARAASLLQAVGLGHRLHHYPMQLSGGEQQRVALARAFISRPAFLLADEPTGNLDSHTGDRIIELLWELHANQGSTLILVTHDPALAGQAQRILSLRDGRLIDDSLPPDNGDTLTRKP
jgi:putative ABC transport system ATP-binding protein